MNQQAAFFDGYRVLDLCDKEGAFAGRMLGGFGCDVIYIEKPGSGNPLRGLGPFYGDIAHPDMSFHHWHYNTNKSGITLDIETPDGQDILKRLVKTADLLFESFAPGYLAGLGLGYSELSQVNPGLVMTSITPFGQTGPYRDFTGSDIIASAMGGQMWPMGEVGKPPLRYTAEQAYVQAGSQAAAAAVIALYHRDATGQGQYIDLSMQEAILGTTWLLHQYWSQGQLLLSRHGRRLGAGGCPIVWKCKDGDIAVFIQTGSQGRKTRQIVDWMASEGMAGDLTEVLWSEVSARNMPEDVLNHWTEVFQRFFLTKTKQEIDDKANADKLQMFIANTPEDFLTDPQLKARDYWVAMDIPDVAEKIPFPNFPVITDKLTRRITRAPLIGEHNQEIYHRELGLSLEEMEQLQDKRVI